MSTLKVEVVRVDDVIPHPNADRLDIAQIRGWQCVVGKGAYQPGELGAYFPIDSVLPEDLEAIIFKDSKITLEKHRVRTIKIRGAVSQGLLVPFRDIPPFSPIGANRKEGDDLTDELGVKKYEPSLDQSPQAGARAGRKQTNPHFHKYTGNPHFHKYTDIENWKNHPNLFEPGELVWVLEKIHGSNFRAGYVPFHANTWWKKVKRFLRLTPTHEFVYGSHNVQLKHNGNIYWEMVEKYQLQSKLKAGEVVYGEVYGAGVQKGYLYDCKPNERKLAIFDLQVGSRYVIHREVVEFCEQLNLPTVPLCAIIPYNREEVKKHVDGWSWLGDQKVREGIVIKPDEEQHTYMGRKILKWKSEQFELTAEDDTH
jgi:RNA ligase (TIGR02306 family)